MASILLAYATGEGQTGKIAERIEAHLVEAGHEVTCEEVTDRPGSVSVGDFEAVVVGASIHAGSHQDWLVDFVRDNRAHLRDRPGAFFQVSLSAASPEDSRRADAHTYVEDFRARTEWDPDLVGNFAGALRYSEYGFWKRLLMRVIAARVTGDTDTDRDHEYTDWDAVERFAGEIAELVVEPDQTATSRVQPG